MDAAASFAAPVVAYVSSTVVKSPACIGNEVEWRAYEIEMWTRASAEKGLRAENAPPEFEAIVRKRMGEPESTHAGRQIAEFAARFIAAQAKNKLDRGDHWTDGGCFP